MTSDQQEVAKARRPIFWRSIFTFILSACSQIYFFVIQRIFLEKENAMDVIQAIVEWIFLLGPSRTRVIFCIICALLWCELVSP